MIAEAALSDEMRQLPLYKVGRSDTVEVPQGVHDLIEDYWPVANATGERASRSRSFSRS